VAVHEPPKKIKNENENLKVERNIKKITRSFPYAISKGEGGKYP